MVATISLYNHTRLRFVNGANAEADVYKIALYTTLPFDATATTKAAAETGATQVTTGNGYTQDDKALANVAFSIFNTNGAKVDADNVAWTAAGGPITASKALIYNDTDVGKPPVAYIDFGEELSAGDGTDFLVNFATDGIVTFTAPV